MQGKKKENISAKWILERISEWQIYNMYIPKLTLDKKMFSPFRKESSPSFSIFIKDDGIFYKDYGAPEFRGDCFTLISQLFGLNYPQALEKAAQDFGLVEGANKSTKIQWKQPKIIQKTFKIATDRWESWMGWHRDYLKQYHLIPKDLNFCKDTRAFPVREWAINGARMPLGDEEVCFEYNLVNERGNWKKIYRPNRSKEEKWKSNIPYREMHGLDNMKGCDVGILTKSLKDGGFLAKYILPCVCIISAEDVTAITGDNMKFLKESCRELYVAMDCDEPGKKASRAITKEMGVKHVNPPDRLLEFGESDFSGMGKAWGVESVIEHFRNKKIIE